MKKILAYILTCFFFIAGVHAQHNDPTTSGHDQFHWWYESLEDGHGNSCCSNKDCRPAAYRFADGVLYMLIQEKWRYVPKHAYRYVNTPDDGGHWCGVVYNEPRYRRHETYCAFLPEQMS